MTHCQALFLTGGLTEREEAELVQRIERSAVRYDLDLDLTLTLIWSLIFDLWSLTLRFDHSSKGELSVREWLNVIKIQNKVDISLASVRLVHNKTKY